MNNKNAVSNIMDGQAENLGKLLPYSEIHCTSILSQNTIKIKMHMKYQRSVLCSAVQEVHYKVVVWPCLHLNTWSSVQLSLVSTWATSLQAWEQWSFNGNPSRTC